MPPEASLRRPPHPRPGNWPPLMVLLCLALVVLGCRTYAPSAVQSQPPAVSQPTAVQPQLTAVLPQASLPAASQPAETQAPAVTIIPAPTFAPPVPVLLTPAGVDEPAPPGEPAGCLAADTQTSLTSVELMLGYADALLGLPRSLSSRRLNETWNVFTRASLPLDGRLVVALNVADVQNEYLLQRMLDSLHVAGFVTWLRVGPVQQLHILAIPLLDPAVLQSDWAGYVQAYWQDRASQPSGDPFVIPALKLPPCAWMVSAGFAPPANPNWWPLSESQPPDLASAASAFLAADTVAANQVARQLDWLGWDGVEAASNMCGPLTWAILRAADVLPEDVGGWSRGPETFWLAKPRTNGRPWSLFPQASYSVYHFGQPLGEFDFSSFALYPGDVLYTYSRDDGFDHMLVVTEIDDTGSRYTVTNLVQVFPHSETSIQRAVLYHPDDPSIGLFKNEWRRDRRNGRTGHDGFDVFRWAWFEKDLNQQVVAYTVQPGDSFGRLAQAWKTPPGWIARYNQMQVSDPLIVGQTIGIPPDEPP